MRKTRTISRWALVRRLHDIALRVAAGKPIRIGGSSVVVPERLQLEEEFETADGEVELELEIKWPAAQGEAAKGGKRALKQAPRRKRAR
jgi:amphi-Trp domain-containing protein